MLSTGTTPPDADLLTADSDESWNRLRARVDGVRTRQRMKYVGTGLLFGLAVFVAAFLGFSAADILFKLSVGMRVLALFSTVIAVAFAIFFCVYRPWRKLGNTIQSAREVEGAYPELEQQLSTALEYGRRPEKRLRATPARRLLPRFFNRPTARRTAQFRQDHPLEAARPRPSLSRFFSDCLMVAYGASAAGFSKEHGHALGAPPPTSPPPTLTEIKSVNPAAACTRLIRA